MTDRKILQLTPRPGLPDRSAITAALDGGRRLLLVIAAPALRSVNRIHGIDAGDALLAELATTLRAAAPETAVIGRLTGAKLALVLDATDADAALAQVGDIYDSFAYLSGGQLAVHIGAAWRRGDVSADEMVTSALTALDQARGDGDQGFDLIEADSGRDSDFTLAKEALAAIRAGRASAAMQPVVDAHTPGRILFREALIRLNRGNGETITAGRFMPALDRLGVAAEADIAVLELAAEAMVLDPSLRVSVNLSSGGLSRPGWRAAFLDIADRHPDVAERLIVEISEQVASSHLSAASELFMQLRVRGVSLALDDFGAGRTSFQHLRDFRFDVLKIDGGFIRSIDASPDNQMLVSALAGIGRQFDMMVIAEFVETAQEARVLRKLGVDGFQGFLFGKPTLVWSEGEAIQRIKA